jgi:hypothetical protein
MTNISLSRYVNDDVVLLRTSVKGHGQLTLIEISNDGLSNLSGELYDPKFELDGNKRLIIKGVDEI